MPTLKSLNEELYHSILNDTRDASPRFVAMRKAYLQMAEVDLDDRDALQENAEKLGRINDFAKIYLSNHGGLHGSQKGQERFSWAKQLKETTDQLCTEKNNELYIEVGENKQFHERVAKDHPEDMENLKKLGKLQRSIGTADFVPRVTDFNLKPSLWQRFKAAVGRGIGHLANGFFSVGTGLATLIGVAPFTTTGAYEETANAQETDMSLVPGTRTGEHFEEFNPELGADDQEVCGDTRRMPISFEELIPEDTNQPPTMTLCFEQGEEGKTMAMGGDKGQGHAFISLKYTRNNAVTGKPERYKCTFGFYPHQDIDSAAVFAAMGATGMIMPGCVENDNNHSYSVSKTFTVNNKTINTVFKKAGEYSKGGYSYLSRSCATFAHDMAEAAGLPADDYFAKTDFEGTQANLMKAASFFGTQAISRVGKHAMLSYAGKDIARYDRFGQKIINREDVQRLSKRQFNARLKGYVPSVATEAARNNWDFHLGSNRYQPQVEEKSEITKEEYSDWEVGNARMMKEQMTLLNSVEKFLKSNKVPKEQIQTLTDNLTEFMATNDKIIENYARTAFPGDYSWEEGKKPTYVQSVEALHSGSKAIKDYIEGLDHIFRSTFKSDSRLNLAFQHMASTLEKLDQGFALQYRNLNFKSFQRSSSVDFYHDEEICKYIDPKRDNFLPLARLNYTAASLKSGKQRYTMKDTLRPNQIVGVIKSFGNLENFLSEAKELESLKTEFGEDSPQYTEARGKFTKRTDVADNFAHGMDSFAGKKSYSVHDVDFAFRELPEAIGNAGFTNSQADPADIYQSLILINNMPGLRKSIEEGLAVAKKNFIEQKEKLDACKDLLPMRDYAKKLTALQLGTQKEISQTVYNFTAENLGKCPLLDRMLENMKAVKYKAAGVDPNTASDADKAPLDNDVFSNFTMLICDGIVRPLITDISERTLVRRNDNLEMEFLKLTEKAVNSSKVEYADGAGQYMDLLRDKFVTGALYTKEEAGNLMKEELKQTFKKNMLDLQTEKKPLDEEAIFRLREGMRKEQQALVRSGKAVPENPEAMTLLSKFIVADILSGSLQGATGGFEEPVNDKLINREMAKLQAYGAFADMGKPENKELVEKALQGDAKARDKLRTKVSENARKISKADKKILDARTEAREKIKDRNKTVKVNDEYKPKRRMSFSK